MSAGDLPSPRDWRRTVRARNRREADRLVRQRLGVLGGRARGLARILEETRRPAEAVAALHLAELADETAGMVP